jgi:hypothetical protein
LKTKIFHALFENYFRSDQHSIFLAGDEKQALEKIKFRLKGSKVEILSGGAFEEKFPKGIKFMVVYYQNGGGEKFCLIATSTGTENEATQIFQQKFPDFAPARIITYEQFKKQQGEQKNKKEKTTTPTSIRRGGITARPYALNVA